MWKIRGISENKFSEKYLSLPRPSGRFLRSRAASACMRARARARKFGRAFANEPKYSIIFAADPPLRPIVAKNLALPGTRRKRIGRESEVRTASGRRSQRRISKTHPRVSDRALRVAERQLAPPHCAANPFPVRLSLRRFALTTRRATARTQFRSYEIRVSARKLLPPCQQLRRCYCPVARRRS